MLPRDRVPGDRVSGSRGSVQCGSDPAAVRLRRSPVTTNRPSGVATLAADCASMAQPLGIIDSCLTG